MLIADKLNHKKILIWGYGREGKSTKNFIDKHCTDAEIEIFEGKREDINEQKYDYIIKSPGIPALELNNKYTSQTELFVDEFREQIIGVTGTKGKSTTSSMLYYVLSKSRKKAVLVGNIGLPCLDRYDEIDKDTIIVYEMSCHQLAHLNISPKISVFLNLHEDHLDYYKTMEKYFTAKCNIFLHSKEQDTAYVGSQVPINESMKKQYKGKIHIIDEKKNYDYKLLLCGSHNQFNAETVFRIISENFDIEKELIKKLMSEFKGLAHRLEYVGEFNGVTYYDDSISTICSSAINAVNAVKNCKTLLVGGMDRGIDYTELLEFIKLKTDVNFICMYAAGKHIYNMAEGLENVCFCDNLEKAVETASKITPKGSACILSPAAASYDSFKNFEERGEAFKNFIYKIYKIENK